jgi:hypothetical protein
MSASAARAVYLALDFDGVLHPEGCDSDVEFCHRDRFEAVMREHPSVRIVVSSMWRTDHSLEQLRALFSSDVAERLVGVTPCLAPPGPHYLRGTRQREIECWMKNHAHEGVWLALDDRSSGFEPRCPSLVLVQEDGIGLQQHHLEELDARLRALTGAVATNHQESSMAPTIPSVLDMLAPSVSSIRDIPSVRASGELIDAALREPLATGAAVAEIDMAALVPENGPVGGVGCMQFVLSMAPGIAELRGRRADGSVVAGNEFLGVMARFARGESAEDGDMGCFYHFDLAKMRSYRADAATPEAALVSGASRRRRP